MTTFGQLALLAAFVASGYAAFASFVGWQREHRFLRCAGVGAGLVGVLAITTVTAMLLIALLTKDFHFAYVVAYSSRSLAWQYALSALWVGQAGSLLLWAWLVGVLSMVYRFWPRRGDCPDFCVYRAGTDRVPSTDGRRWSAVVDKNGTVPFSAPRAQSPLRIGRRITSGFVAFRSAKAATFAERKATLIDRPILSEPTFAILMAYQCFLLAIMVFGADPMQPTLAIPPDGAGLSPDLQHPAMLLHPPVVFLGYAACAIPFALAMAALLNGRLDAAWTREARPWMFFAWVILGIGILLGAYWAYEELGWGGYWSWDPVENGSLIPWLTVTATIHAAMVYRHRGA